jgi:hypothetical protein
MPCLPELRRDERLLVDRPLETRGGSRLPHVAWLVLGEQDLGGLDHHRDVVARGEPEVDDCLV